MQFDGFDWDRGNCDKCQKHGASLAEIESLFSGAPFVGPDMEHFTAETRFRAVGLTLQGRHIFVVFTLRHRGRETLIRPLSARYMHKKEVEAYENQISHLQDRR